MNKLWFGLWLLLAVPSVVARAELRVGAAKVDISPEQLPVLVNGGMTSRTADSITTRIHARAIVLDDGDTRIGLCVVDSCMLPKSICDEAKSLASTRTGLSPEKMMISATHTHTAPSSIGALGTDADPYYVSFIRLKIAEAFTAAETRLQPAKVGWGSGQAANFTALRRWVLRPDRIRNDPFGNPTVRATMHAARNPDDAIGPTGPEDPELAIIGFESLDGQPIAVLSNFSMHYFGGEQAISADYFGHYCSQFEHFLSGADESDVVAIMSHGCSGDIWRRDYMTPTPEEQGSMIDYSLGLLEIAKQIYGQIEFRHDADLAMEQSVLPMRYRVPNLQRLEWAHRIVQEMGDRLPQTQPEIYAREQIFLDQWQETEIVVQAMRIGDIAIATTPNETYALTGLKLKLQSPLSKTMVIELANGGDGYIPPPEQHRLGGYNTWAARSAGLEETAEPRVVASGLMLLESVCGKPRRPLKPPTGPAAIRVLSEQPIAYWQLGEVAPPTAHDSSGHGKHAFYEPGVLFFLDGPQEFAKQEQLNRCAHFAGGRLRAELPELRHDFTIILSFWNGMPLGSRDVLGWMFSLDHDHGTGSQGIHLGLDREGKMLLQLGRAEPISGSRIVNRWQWTRVALTCEEGQLKLFLGDTRQPEIAASLELADGQRPATWFFGGRSDNQSNWEGKLDEIAVFDRALDVDELAAMSAKEQ